MYDLQVNGQVDSAAESGQLASLLEEFIECLSGLGEDYAPLIDDLQYIRQRYAEGRFHLAVLGQFKRGKSTLLNALLGADLLPTDILPVTAIPTYISFGRELKVQVYYTNQSEPTLFVPSAENPLADFLQNFVTETGNPHNKRQVDRVEISHPSELLRQGVVLIDTPGIGSTLKHNTEVAYQVLPQCDAALFLVSPDPPITAMELEYLEKIKQRLPRTFFLLNKVDFLSTDERLSSLKFLANQLEPLCDGLPQVLPISARNGLRARLEENPQGWQESGMLQVEQSLVDFFAREKQQTLQEALSRRTKGLVATASMQLRLSLSALKLPEDELQKRIVQFRQSLPAVQRERQAVDDILAGDLKRAILRLGEVIDTTRIEAKQQIAAQVEELLLSLEDVEELERQVRSVLAEETGPFFTQAMRKVAEVIRQEATDLLSLNQQRSNQLIEQVRQTAAQLFDIPYHAPLASSSYSPFMPPAWSSELFISDLDPLGQRISRKFFTQKYRRKRTVARLREECRKLLNQNVEQISWTLRRSLDESFRQFGAELGEQLEKTIDATRTAMEVALERKASHLRETASDEIAMQQALDKLDKLNQELAD